ncbi:MAG: PAS domain S-box protein [Bacteroidales bacterium]|nr:PAS domain S-box protein [Bacteroidales bacterium]
MQTDEQHKLNRIIDIANLLNEQCFIIDKFDKLVFVNKVFICSNNLTEPLNLIDQFKVFIESSSIGHIQIGDKLVSCFELNMIDNKDYRLFILHDEIYQSKSDALFDKQVLDVIPDMLFVYDSNYNIIFSNNAGCDFLKFDKIENKSSACYTLEDEVSKCEDSLIQKGFKTGNNNQTIKYFPDYNKWFDIRVYPIKDNNNKVWRLIEHRRDITVQKENENKLIDIEEQKSRLIGNVPGIVYRCKLDKSWTMLFMSYETFNITGYAPEEFLNSELTYNSIILPEDRKSVFFKIQETVSLNKNFIIEYRILTKDNKIKFVWEKGKVVVGEDEEYIDGVILDITDRKKAEIELANQEEKYRLLVKNQNELIVKIDKHGRIIFVNDAYCEVFGKTEKDLLNENFMYFIHQDDREMVSKAMLELLSPPYSCYLEQRVLTVHGWRWFAWSYKAILRKNIEIVEIIGVGRDFTDKKSLESELIEAKNKAENNEKQKSNFILQAYQRIKLPIKNVTLSLLDQKDKQLDSPVYTDLLRETLTIISIIEGFSNIVLFSEKDINVIQEKFDIKEAFLLVYNMFKKDAQRFNTKFTFDGDPETSNLIVADKVRILRILLHLLSNSFKNSVDGEINFGYTYVSSSKLILYVTDSSKIVNVENFSGIYASSQEIINNHRENLDQIDLILAKLYVGQLGGRLDIKTREDSKTEFCIEIPVTRFHSNSSLENAKPALSNVDLSSSIVLVAEDDEINFHLIKTILNKVGATVIGAISGEEAINRVKENKDISIVIMDINMPVIGGIEALHKIRKIRSELPVIACTAYPQSDELTQLENTSFDGFLPKPINRDELYQIIKNFSLL